MTTVSHPPKKGYRTIRLPLSEAEYDRFIQDRPYAKSRLEELHFTDPSRKQELRCRRIRLEQGGEVFTVAPAFVMPYMSGRTKGPSQGHPMILGAYIFLYFKPKVSVHAFWRFGADSAYRKLTGDNAWSPIYADKSYKHSGMSSSSCVNPPWLP